MPCYLSLHPLPPRVLVAPCADYVTLLALSAVCRAVAVDMLVGFWFDGGLFKLATGATFWVLLELGREQPIMSP